MNTHVKRAIIDHALALPREEVCGFIYQSEEGVHAYPCVNVSVEDKAETFEIAPSDYAHVRGLGRVCGIYHGGATHTNAAFSEEDIAMAREMCLPLHLCAASGQWSVYIPETHRIDTVGQAWCWGEQDCYEAVRTHYRQERGVYLTDYERDETFEHAEESAIVKHIADEGFVYVDRNTPILTHDVLLFRTPGTVYPHHLSVLVAPNRILHHPRGQLSRIDDLDGTSLRRLAGVLRYVGKAAL